MTPSCLVSADNDGTHARLTFYDVNGAIISDRVEGLVAATSIARFSQGRLAIASSGFTATYTASNCKYVVNSRDELGLDGVVALVSAPSIDKIYAIGDGVSEISDMNMIDHDRGFSSADLSSGFVDESSFVVTAPSLKGFQNGTIGADRALTSGSKVSGGGMDYTTIIVPGL